MVNNMTDLTAQDAAWSTRDHPGRSGCIGELRNRFRAGYALPFGRPAPASIPVVWVSVNNATWRLAILAKTAGNLTSCCLTYGGMDEPARTRGDGLPPRIFRFLPPDFHYGRNRDIMLRWRCLKRKTTCALTLKLPNANCFDVRHGRMFGIDIRAHAPDAHHDAANTGRPSAA